MNGLDHEFSAGLMEDFEKDKSQSRVITEEDFKKRSVFKKMFDFCIGTLHSEL